MAYSAVSQPQPLPRRKGGTPSSTDAVQITRVPPVSIRQLPAAVDTKLGIKRCARGALHARPSLRSIIKNPPECMGNKSLPLYN